MPVEYDELETISRTVAYPYDLWIYTYRVTVHSTSHAGVPLDAPQREASCSLREWVMTHKTMLVTKDHTQALAKFMWEDSKL